MKSLLVRLSVLFHIGLTGVTLPVHALEKISVTEAQLTEDVYEIVVPGGHSVVLAFENDEYIQSIWLDDQSILGVVTDRPLCAYSSGNLEQEGCGFAQYLRLTGLSRTAPGNAPLLDLNGPSFTYGGGETTLLTVVTTNRDGGDRAIYQFAPIVTTSRRSDVSLISIVNAGFEYDVAAIKTGQLIAVTQAVADQDSADWEKLLEFLNLVEEGVDVQEAIDRSQVSTELLKELQRRGSSTDFDVTYQVEN